jgi:hypothetical protein
MRILVVEDDVKLARQIAAALTEGWRRFDGRS